MAYIDQFGIPEDVGASLGMSPPFVQSRDEAVARLAQQRATKWRQRLAGLAGGLAASAKATNFGDALLSGLSGSLGAGEKFASQEDERQLIRNRQAMADQIAQREADQRAIGLAQTQQKIIEDERHNREWEALTGLQNQSKGDKVGSELDLWRTDRAAWQKLQQDKNRFSGQEDAPIIDDQTLNDYADALATTGTFPNLGGFGKYGTKVKMMIGQRASQRHPGLNIGKVAADYKANSAAFSKLTQQSSGLEAFSETARRNSDILLETANTIPDLGNRPLNNMARRAAAALGDQNMARFNTALETVVPEFARILQSGGQITGQPLTDTQKKDLRAVLHGDFTRGQLRASVDILKREIDNRKAAQERSMKQLQDKITPSSGNHAPDADPLGILGGP